MRVESSYKKPNIKKMKVGHQKLRTVEIDELIVFRRHRIDSTVGKKVAREFNKTQRKK